jgi:hypothetical protein
MSEYMLSRLGRLAGIIRGTTAKSNGIRLKKPYYYESHLIKGVTPANIKEGVRSAT